MILAIDPGYTRSAWLYLDAKRIHGHGLAENAHMVELLNEWAERSVTLAVEMIASYGMPVGREVFETVLWIGRFVQAWQPCPYRLVYRKDVKMHLCGNSRAKDGNVRQALIDIFGPPGTKKQPGGTYGIKGDEWSALAVAFTAESL